MTTDFHDDQEPVDNKTSVWSLNMSHESPTCRIDVGVFLELSPITTSNSPSSSRVTEQKSSSDLLDVLHSTFKYPLNSTLADDEITQNKPLIDNFTTLSNCAQKQPSPKHKLRRQFGRTKLRWTNDDTDVSMVANVGSSLGSPSLHHQVNVAVTSQPPRIYFCHRNSTDPRTFSSSVKNARICHGSQRARQRSLTPRVKRLSACLHPVYKTRCHLRTLGMV